MLLSLIVSLLTQGMTKDGDLAAAPWRKHSNIKGHRSEYLLN